MGCNKNHWKISNPLGFLKINIQVTGKTNVSESLPTGQLSNVPWRRADVKYTNNEAYFDVIEEIDAIIDKQGATVSAEIQGYVSMSPESWRELWRVPRINF